MIMYFMQKTIKKSSAQTLFLCFNIHVATYKKIYTHCIIYESEYRNTTQNYIRIVSSMNPNTETLHKMIHALCHL